MENAKTLVSHLNKDLVQREDDIKGLIKWHEENHKNIAGVNWKELDKVEGLGKKLKKHLK
jgi:predicted secreted Zn-dependent protease